MNEAELRDICFRIAEYNLRSNNYFRQGIREFNMQDRKMLEVERERLTSYVRIKFPNININNCLRQLRKKDDEGRLIPDMPNDIDVLMKMLKEGMIEEEW